MLLASVCMLHRIGLHGSLASRASMRWIWCKDSEALGGKGGPNGAKADAALSANRKSDGWRPTRTTRNRDGEESAIPMRNVFWWHLPVD